MAKKIKTEESIPRKTVLIAALEQYIGLSEKYKNCYFWTPSGAATSRRKEEEENSFAEKKEKFFAIEFNLRCSCKNYYITKNIEIYKESLNLLDAKKLIEQLVR